MFLIQIYEQTDFGLFKRAFKKVICSLVVSSVTFFSAVSNAQQQQENDSNASDFFLEELVVTARKRPESELDAPLAVTAYGDKELDVLKVRDLQGLSVAMPNVSLDDVGTARGIANFSVRGLGINSSIVTIDPTVGTFVDGVYLGTNQGVVFDLFDLDGIEVLRGPQGTLFGRNVTGGAVLLNTKAPSDTFGGKFRFAYESGGEKPNKYLMGTVGGPVSETLSAKISLYSNKDDGYHKNLFNGEAFGKAETVSARPMIVWAPSDAVSLSLIYDYFDTEGQGPAAQSHTNGLGVANRRASFDRKSFDFSIDEDGSIDLRSDFIRSHLEIETENGAVTNIFGYRKYEQISSQDIDSSPINMFTSGATTQVKQISNELRYAGYMGEKTFVTTGVYYFTNDILYSEKRNLLGFLAPPGRSALITQHGGGDYEVTTLGVFASVDYSINPKFTLNAGLRYTDEEKKIGVASLSLNRNSPCSVIDSTCKLDFNDEKSWSNLSPKLGFTYKVSDQTLTYGYWTRGIRSGGYNIRNSAADTVNFGPGPFDEETVDSFELGFKKRFNNGGRITGAIFNNQVSDMQREVNLSDPNSGVVQVIRNTADANIKGIELDGIFPLTDSLMFRASVGYLNSKYDTILFDISGDGVVNAKDLALGIPRAPDLTYSAGFTLDTPLGNWGYMLSRINYSYRDKVFYTDNNLGFIDEQGIVDVGVDFISNNEKWVFGFYGKNLTDEVKHGGDTLLPSRIGPVPLGGTFAPLAKGKVYGVDVTYSF